MRVFSVRRMIMDSCKPLFDNDPNVNSHEAASPAVRALIQPLVNEQSYVLCVQGGDGRGFVHADTRSL